jgi:hypothetical protein
MRMWGRARRCEGGTLVLDRAAPSKLNRVWWKSHPGRRYRKQTRGPSTTSGWHLTTLRMTSLNEMEHCRWGWASYNLRSLENRT